MKCGQLAEDMSALLDGVLEGHRRTHLESHLAGCASCKEEYLYLQGVVGLVRELPELDPPQDFLAQVMERKAQEEQAAAGGVQPLSPVRWDLRRWAMLAAASLIMAVGLWQWNGLEEKGEKSLPPGSPVNSMAITAGGPGQKEAADQEGAATDMVVVADQEKASLNLAAVAVQDKASSTPATVSDQEKAPSNLDAMSNQEKVSANPAATSGRQGASSVQVAAPGSGAVAKQREVAQGAPEIASVPSDFPEAAAPPGPALRMAPRPDFQVMAFEEPLRLTGRLATSQVGETIAALEGWVAGQQGGVLISVTPTAEGKEVILGFPGAAWSEFRKLADTWGAFQFQGSQGADPSQGARVELWLSLVHP